MRFLFTSAQLPGHLDWGGYLATARALVARGHDVLWVSGAAVEAQVRAAGVPFHIVSETGWRWPPPPALPRAVMADDAWAAARAQRALDQWLDVERVATAATELEPVATAFRPHLLVTEHFVAAAALVAERLALRMVVAGWPAYAQRRTTSPTQLAIVEDFQQRLAAWGSSGRYFAAGGAPGLESPFLHITYWSESWYGGAPNRSAQTRHVGGSSAPPPAPPDNLPSPDARPWLLVTLGTTFNDDPAFFVAAAHAAQAVGAQPLVATGHLPAEKANALRQRLPEGAVVRPTFDFNAVLPYTAAAIHHGGAGTTHALVTHALPQIVVPHAGDQVQQAQGVARTGVGEHIPSREVTIARLTEELRLLLPEVGTARVHARTLRDEFAALGGPPAAADLLEAQAASANAPL